MTTTSGTDGSDTLVTGSGDDIVEGGDANDVIVSGKGDDVVDGGEGSDVVNAGQGDDTLVYTYVSSDIAKDIYIGGTGTDTLLLYISQDDADASSLAEQIAAFNAKLAQAGGTATPTFTFTFANGSTLTISTIEQITLNYTNSSSPPVLADIAAATYTDTQADDAFGATTGTLTCSHIDAGKTPTYGIDGVTTAAITVLGGIGYDTSQASSFGTLYLNSSTGQYHFEPIDAAVEGLKASQVLDFTFTVSDGTSTTSKTFAITLAGFNDTPELAPVAPGALIDTPADDSFAPVNGVLSSTDRDAGDSATYGITDGSATSLSGFDVEKGGAYGTLYLNSTTGAYQYVPDDTAIEALKSVTSESFDLTVTDGSGAMASQTLMISLAGANDTPELAASLTMHTYEDSAGNDSFAVVNGTLSSTDRDAGDSATYGITNGSASSLPGFDVAKLGAYGTLYLNSTTGAYQYVPDDTAIEGLKSTTSESFDLTVTDASGAMASQTLTLTLDGTNDLAAITGTPTGQVTEDGWALTSTGSQIARGTLSVSDADAGDGIFQPIAPADLVKAYGSFTFDPVTGNWTYTLNNTAAQGLNSGETRTETLTVTSFDGTATQTIMVTITGANEPNVITSYSPGSQTSGDDVIWGSSGSDNINGGGGNDVIYGMDGSDSLSGNNNNDVLNGGLGLDTLNGNNGGDIFVFDTALSASNVDTITGFTTSVDRIALELGIFSALAPADAASGEAYALTSDQFVAASSLDSGTTARIVYDSATGSLSYDANGGSASDAVVFAQLGAGTVLNASDITIYTN